MMLFLHIRLPRLEHDLEGVALLVPLGPGLRVVAAALVALSYAAGRGLDETADGTFAREGFRRDTELAGLTKGNWDDDDD